MGKLVNSQESPKFSEERHTGVSVLVVMNMPWKRTKSGLVAARRRASGTPYCLCSSSANLRSLQSKKFFKSSHLLSWIGHQFYHERLSIILLTLDAIYIWCQIH